MYVSSKMFLKNVTQYIHSKEAKQHVTKELEHHLNVTTINLMKHGFTKVEAEEKAVAQMGSPMTLGKSLNRIYKPKWDMWLIGGVVLLLIVSFLQLSSVDYTFQFGHDLKDSYMRRQVIYVLLALGIIFACTFYDYRRLKKYSVFLYGVAALGLVWLNVAPNYFLNGESLLKFGPFVIHAWTLLPLITIGLAGLCTYTAFKWWHFIALYIVTVIAFLNVPNMTVAFLYSCIAAVLFTYSTFSKKVKYIGWSLAIFALFIVSAYLVYIYRYTDQVYQLARIHAFLHPELYEGDYGHDMITLNMVLGDAGWFGASDNMPFFGAHTDYALVQLIHVYGYSAGLAVIICIILIAIRILYIVRTMPSSFGKYIVISAATLYITQSVYSVLMIVGLLPLIDIPLPFISYGATTLFINAMLIGFISSVYRRKMFLQLSLKKASL